MATSVFSTMVGLLDTRSIDDIATRLGESREAVSSGIQSSAASLIDGLAHRSGDSNWMGQIFSLVSQAPKDLNIPNLTSAVTNPTGTSTPASSVLDSGKRLLSQVFGGSQSFVTQSIAERTGLRQTSTSVLMSMAAPMLMTSLGHWVREGKVSALQLGGLFSNEGASVRNLVPSAVEDLFERKSAINDATVRPLAIGAVAEPERKPRWMWLIPLLLLIPFVMWLMSRLRSPDLSQVTDAARVTAADVGSFVTRALPNNPNLSVPKFGIESRLLEFIQDPSKLVEDKTWFDFDRLSFDTDSATLRPESMEQLRNIAAIMRAYPSVHLKIGGYTDNTGDVQHNSKLAQDRAEGVMGELTKLGVGADRLEAQGYGDQHAVADNATEQGRAQNRRISVRVTQK
jgi:OOP family OmpA-OmpF porin